MQSVLFISEEKLQSYPKINHHYTWIPCHFSELTFETLSKLWYDHKPVAIYSYGNLKGLNILSTIYQVRKKWIHLDNLPEEIDVIPNVYSAIFKHKYEDNHPLMSIITTSYKSKHKILRPLRSLQSQSYPDWEWIIWDDSDGDENFNQLVEMQKKDLRIRVYKGSHNSGYIGEVKRLAASVAYGKFIVEVDHDDDLHPDMLKWIYEASIEYPDAQFFYTDCAELEEDTYIPATYGDFFGLGYCVHLNIWSDFHKCYLSSAIAPPPNAVSLSHIVGVPNHVRCWKTEFYEKIGKHNPWLSVADDYELLLRSFIGGKWCHIRKCAYYQYRNRDGNFTFIRNSLIQHNTYHSYRNYYPLLPHDIPYTNSPQWKIDEPIVKSNYDYVPIEDRYEKVIVFVRDCNSQEVIEELKSCDHIYIVGKLPDSIPPEYYRKISWWNLGSDDVNDKIRFAQKFLNKWPKGEFIIKC